MRILTRLTLTYDGGQVAFSEYDGTGGPTFCDKLHREHRSFALPARERDRVVVSWLHDRVHKVLLTVRSTCVSFGIQKLNVTYMCHTECTDNTTAPNIQRFKFHGRVAVENWRQRCVVNERACVCLCVNIIVCVLMPSTYNIS